MTDTNASSSPDSLESVDLQWQALRAKAEGQERKVVKSQHDEVDQSVVKKYDDLLWPFLKITFQGLFPGWGIQDEEIDLLSQSYAEVLAKHWPTVSEWGPEIGAGIATGSVIAPRLIARLPRQIEPQVNDGSQEKH